MFLAHMSLLIGENLIKNLLRISSKLRDEGCGCK
jgi:hypothetical protein